MSAPMPHTLAEMPARYRWAIAELEYRAAVKLMERAVEAREAARVPALAELRQTGPEDLLEIAGHRYYLVCKSSFTGNPALYGPIRDGQSQTTTEEVAP